MWHFVSVVNCAADKFRVLSVVENKDDSEGCKCSQCMYWLLSRYIYPVA